MTGYALTLGLGFVLGYLARNLRLGRLEADIPVHTIERRQMLVKSGDL